MAKVALIFLFAAPLFAQQTASAVVRLESTISAGHRPQITFPRLSLHLAARRPVDLEAVPALGPLARYATARIGRRVLPLAFDAPKGAWALGLLYTGSKQPAFGRARADVKAKRVAVDFFDVPTGDLRIDVSLRYQGPRLVEAALQPSRHRRGRAVLRGRIREVILVDADADGRYNGPRDRWVALRVDRIKNRPVLRKAQAQLLDEPQVPFETDGAAFMVERVAEDGSSLVLVRGPPQKSAAEVLARRYREVRQDYFRRFETEEEEFVAAQGIDVGRPKVKDPVAWLATTLSDATARAAKARKPLLAWFISESNPWCFRYAFYTFPDREVDALLRRFVLVRIDVEKDPERSYLGTGARGLPTLLPRTAQGKPITFRVRNRDPEGKVADLKRPDTLITGWQRPQELAANLRRILARVG